MSGHRWTWLRSSLLAIGVALPILWLFVISLKTRAAALSTPPQLQFVPTMEHYRWLLTDPVARQAVLNSAIVAACSTLASLAIGIPAAYWLANLPTERREKTGYSIVAARLLPSVGLAVPLFLWMRTLGLLDTRAALILVYTGSNSLIAVWLLASFFKGVPRQLYELAILEGETELGRLLRLVLPLSASGVLVVSALTFMAAWNEFTFALILTSREAVTLPVLIPGLVTPQGTYWGRVAAVAMVSSLPIVVGGLIAGAVARRSWLAVGADK